MDYFKHSTLGYNAYKSLVVHQVLSGLAGYAKSCYSGSGNGAWEEALNLSYFHIMENFDWKCEADLTHYATKVVRTILINKNAKETGEETTLIAAIDKKSFQENYLNPLDLIPPMGKDSISLDTEDCMDYLVPMFIKDYKFFKSKKPEDRVLTYNGLFDKFSEATVASAMACLVDTYGKDVEEFLELRNLCHFRNFPKDRYKNDLDETVEYKCMFKNVLIYKRLSGRLSRGFYRINLEEVLLCLVETFYVGKLSKKIRGVNVYCTLSGNLVLTEEELVDTLEREIVGAIIARVQGTKVLCYEERKSLIISSSKDLLEGINFTILGENFNIEVEQLVARCANK